MSALPEQVFVQGEAGAPALGAPFAPARAPRPTVRAFVLRRRRALIALVVVATAAGLFAALHRPGATATGDKAATAALTVSVDTVKRLPLTRSLLVTGSLAAYDELPLGTETSGLQIVEVLVEQGDAVRKGQVLARLDDKVLRAQLVQAEALIAQREAELQEAQANAANAQSIDRRGRNLLTSGFISSQDAETRRTTLAAMQARVGVSERQLAAAHAQQDEIQAKLAQTEIRAPTDGTISDRKARLGRVPNVGEELFRLIRDDQVELQARVPEVDLARLAVGQTALVSTSGEPAHTAEGRVWLIAPTVDAQTRIGTVRISLPRDPAFRPGMFVRAQVDTGTADALQVPESALVYRDGKPNLVIVGDGQRVRLQPVETGLRRRGMVEIRNGAAEGATIVAAGAGFLHDGDLVRIEAPIAPTATAP